MNNIIFSCIVYISVDDDEEISLVPMSQKGMGTKLFVCIK